MLSKGSMKTLRHCNDPELADLISRLPSNHGTALHQQGSKKKNLNKQEMSKYLRFIVQRMKERVRRTSFSVIISIQVHMISLLSTFYRSSSIELEP